MVGGGAQGSANACLNDWLLIGCARVADKLPIPNSCEDRICGGTFNIEISATEKTISSKNWHTEKKSVDDGKWLSFNLDFTYFCSQCETFSIGIPHRCNGSSDRHVQ